MYLFMKIKLANNHLLLLLFFESSISSLHMSVSFLRNCPTFAMSAAAFNVLKICGQLMHSFEREIRKMSSHKTQASLEIIYSFFITFYDDSISSTNCSMLQMRCF